MRRERPLISESSFEWSRQVLAVDAADHGNRQREDGLCNGVSPWLAPLAMAITQDLALPAFFSGTKVVGREHLPASGPILLAPTHRARWDALLLPLAAGRRVTGRDCRFMVTLDEMAGVQGWFLHRLGCFSVNQDHPGTASLRLALDLLGRSEQVVVFPEGRIQRQDGPINLQQGLARLAQMARTQGWEVPVVPIGIAYSTPVPQPGGQAVVSVGAPLWAKGQGRQGARDFTAALAQSMRSAEQAARQLVGRPIDPP